MARVLTLATVALVSFSWWIEAWRPWRLVVVAVVVVVVAVVALLGRGCSRVELCVAGIVRESAIWWSVAMVRAIGGGGPCGPLEEVCFS